MLHHRTTDPGERAEHIAEGEAEKVLKETENLDLYHATFFQILNASLRELQPLPECD